MSSESAQGGWRDNANFNQSVTFNTNDASYNPGSFFVPDNVVYPSVGCFPGVPPLIAVDVDVNEAAQDILAVENAFLKEENERLKLEVARLMAIVDLRRIVKELEQL